MIDQAARDAICQDLLTNMLVEASAGSGKTHSLTSRMVAGILADTYRVEHMAAVTFTRKAAAELSNRLHLALERAACDEPEPARRERALQALAGFEQLFVGTVHSFCARLLRQYPVQAGISPGFRELEEDEDELLRRQALRAGLDEPEGRRLVRLLSEFDATPSDLAAALALMSDHGEVDYPAPSVERPDLEPAWESLDRLAEFLEARLPECAEREPTCKILLTGRALLRRRDQARRDTPRDLLRLMAEWNAELKPIKKYWGDKRADQDARLEPVVAEVVRFRAEVARPCLHQWRTHLYSQAMPFLVTVRERAQRERQSQGLVNFNDLLRQCARLLRENPDVRAKLQEKVRHLLVDEFQDTDPIQAEIFQLLAGDPPRPGSLFLVGDPKQSIYRFRRADIETYNAVRQRIEVVLSLQTSFRSQAPLCDWVNGVFQSLLPEQPTREQAAFAALAPLSGASGAGPVWKMTLATARYTEVSAQEAPQIAERIAAWVAGGDYTWGDFLVLTARKVDLLHYQVALGSRGIPCLVSADPSPLSDTGHSLIQLMRVLANPQDAINLVGVLRGPLFGYSDEELFVHCHQGGELRMPSSTPGHPEVAVALEKLHTLHKMVRRLPLHAAVSQVLEETGLRALEPGGELGAIAEFLGACGERGLTLSEALTELSDLDRVPIPPPQAGQRDVVRVMNLHKAKGLEARVVFLAAPTSGLPQTANHFVQRREGRNKGALCLAKFRKPLAHHPDWEAMEAQELAYIAAERHRLLYVAATRARETLVVSRWSGGHASAHRPWADLEPFLEGCPELALEPCELSTASPVSPPADLAAHREACRQPSWGRTSVTANNVSKGLSPTLPPDGVQGDGAAWGELIHKLLEQLARRPELTRGELESLARWFTFEVPEMADYLEAALDTVERVRQSDFWARVLGARERLVEVPFGVRHERTLMFGAIDLAMRQEEGWDLVDYKTDRIRLEALIAVYADQVQGYARSWEGVTDQRVHYAGLYGTREARLSDDLSPRPNGT